MDSFVVVAGAITLSILSLLLVTSFSRAKLRSQIPGWDEIGSERRKRIVHAVSAGRAVDDPRNAGMAVAFAEHALKQSSRRRLFGRWFRRWHYGIFALALFDLAVIAATGFSAASLIPLGLGVYAAGRRRSQDADDGA